MVEPDDFDDLREQFPEWEFGSSWSSAGAGPDRYILWAKRGDLRLTAWSKFELITSIRMSVG